MRRPAGHYGADSGGGGPHHLYGGAAAQANQHHYQNNKSGYYRGLAEKESHQHHNQWRREREDAQTKLSQAAVSPTAPYAEGQGHEPPRSYYQGQRLDPRMSLKNQGGGDPLQAQEEDMDIGYEDNRVLQTFESLEQRFLDDILKLSKEQTDAEDAENARHRERISAINAKYEEQLIILRGRHASRREEFLRRESQARRQKYQQLATEPYPSSGMGPGDPQGYNAGTEPNSVYNSDYHDSCRERGRFPGNAREHGYEPKVTYPRGRSYGTGSRYY